MKQFNFSFNQLAKSLLFLSLVFAFASCSSDDDAAPVPVDEDVTFRIDLVKFAALEIKEAEGERLEIYGSINTKLVRDNITEDNMLWSQAATEALGVGLSDVPVVSSVTYTVAASNLAASSFIVTADLFDYDGGGDNPSEDLGKEEITTPLSSITSPVTFSIVLNDSSGQVVQVTYSITRL